ncbi:MAG: tripartite tricarboxylate transporter substrate binding protein [Enhydrobacter sp.]|nr:tripartite tricarboxylate transporter substrate binding protein [Enhydrobacter sp.]
MTHFGRRTVLAGLATAVAGRATQANDWPEKTVTWVLPFPAGGPSDGFARLAAELVGKELGQTVVIDNRSGAGGMVGAAVVARSRPDGYTMLIGFTGHTYASLIYAHPGFDLARDFVPISAIDRVQSVLLVNPTRLDVSSLQQFLEAARAKPDSIDMASGGLGTIPHLAIELLQIRAKVKLRHVPYRGGAPALQDLLSGQVAGMFATAGLAQSHVKAGKLRALAVAGRRREALLPEVPTFEEAGLPDFRAISWDGVFAPKGTPEPVLDRMHAAIQKALGSDKVRQQWAALGARVDLESRADFAAFIAQDGARWSAVIKAAGIKPE